MAPKRKAPDDEAQPPAAKKQLAAGGARAGAGRKKKQDNQPGLDAAGGPKRTQPTLADLLGQRTPKQPKPTEAAAVELVTWVYDRHDGEDKSTAVAQQQRRGGRVQWFGAGEGATVTLLKKGPEIYYANRDLIADVEVESTHEKATVRERHGGKLQLQVTTGDGTLQAPVWVTWGHVLVADEAGPAGGAGGATPDPAGGGGADRLNPNQPQLNPVLQPEPEPEPEPNQVAQRPTRPMEVVPTMAVVPRVVVVPTMVVVVPTMAVVVRAMAWMRVRTPDPLRRTVVGSSRLRTRSRRRA